MTGTRPRACSTAMRATRSFSVSDSEINSPLVPSTNNPWTPASIRRSTSTRRPASSISSSWVMGVISAGTMPLNTIAILALSPLCFKTGFRSTCQHKRLAVQCPRSRSAFTQQRSIRSIKKILLFLPLFIDYFDHNIREEKENQERRRNYFDYFDRLIDQIYPFFTPTSACRVGGISTASGTHIDSGQGRTQRSRAIGDERGQCQNH